jgi:hypothetical protein
MNFGERNLDGKFVMIKNFLKFNMRDGKKIVIRCDYSPPVQLGSLSDYYTGGGYEQGRVFKGQLLYTSLVRQHELQFP